jgi:hypothetical protein
MIIYLSTVSKSKKFRHLGMEADSETYSTSIIADGRRYPSAKKNDERGRRTNAIAARLASKLSERQI